MRSSGLPFRMFADTRAVHGSGGTGRPCPCHVRVAPPNSSQRDRRRSCQRRSRQRKGGRNPVPVHNLGFHLHLGGRGSVSHPLRTNRVFACSRSSFGTSSSAFQRIDFGVGLRAPRWPWVLRDLQRRRRRRTRRRTAKQARGGANAMMGSDGWTHEPPDSRRAYFSTSNSVEHRYRSSYAFKLNRRASISKSLYPGAHVSLVWARGVREANPRIGLSPAAHLSCASERSAWKVTAREGRGG